MEDDNRILTAFQRKHLQKSLDSNLRSEYRRRIEIILMADAGQTQTQICQQLGCSHETARYWMTIAQSGEALNWSDRPMGRPKTVNEHHRQRLRELVSQNPREFGYAFRKWTARWLAKQLQKETGLTISNRYVNHLLKEMGLSTRNSTRPNLPNSAEKESPKAIADESNRDSSDPNRLSALLETG